MPFFSIPQWTVEPGSEDGVEAVTGHIRSLFRHRDIKRSMGITKKVTVKIYVRYTGSLSNGEM